MGQKYGRYGKIYWLYSKEKYLGKYMVHVKIKTLEDGKSAKIRN